MGGFCAVAISRILYPALHYNETMSSGTMVIYLSRLVTKTDQAALPALHYNSTMNSGTRPCTKWGLPFLNVAI